MKILPTTKLSELKKSLKNNNNQFDEKRLARSLQQTLRVEGYDVSYEDALRAAKDINDKLI